MTETVATVAPDARPAPQIGVRPDVVAQTVALARRSVRGTARQPASWLPSMFFPLMIAAVNAAAMGRSTNLPGFPKVDSFLQFLLPATIVQGVLFGGIMGGTDVALDIENGFFERLVASPVARSSILVGRLAGAGVLGACQAVVFMAVFMLFGARIDGGIAAMAVLIVVAMILAVAVGGFCAAIALRTGAQEAVQNSFPLIFVLLFMSSAFFPTTLMTGWFQTLAVHNPMSWLMDSARNLVIADFDLGQALEAIGLSCCVAVVTVAIATRQFRRRLAVSA